MPIRSLRGIFTFGSKECSSTASSTRRRHFRRLLAESLESRLALDASGLTPQPEPKPYFIAGDDPSNWVQEIDQAEFSGDSVWLTESQLQGEGSSSGAGYGSSSGTGSSSGGGGGPPTSETGSWTVTYKNYEDYWEYEPQRDVNETRYIEYLIKFGDPLKGGGSVNWRAQGGLFPWSGSSGIGAATSGLDFEAVSPGQLSVPAGTDYAEFTVRVNILRDDLLEYPETFELQLYNAQDSGISGSAGYGVISDSTPAVDLDNDANNDGAINSFDDPTENTAPAALIPHNSDDDNENSVVDSTENGFVQNENDLEEIRLWVAQSGYHDVPNFDGWKVVLTVGSGGKVWGAADKSIPITYNQAQSGYEKSWTIGTDSIPTTLYFEQFAVGSTTLSLQLQRPNSDPFGSPDPVLFTAPQVCAVEQLHSAPGSFDETTSSNNYIGPIEAIFVGKDVLEALNMVDDLMNGGGPLALGEGVWSEWYEYTSAVSDASAAIQRSLDKYVEEVGESARLAIPNKIEFWLDVLGRERDSFGTSDQLGLWMHSLAINPVSYSLDQTGQEVPFVVSEYADAFEVRIVDGQYRLFVKPEAEIPVKLGFAMRFMASNNGSTITVEWPTTDTWNWEVNGAGIESAVSAANSATFSASDLFCDLKTELDIRFDLDVMAGESSDTREPIRRQAWTHVTDLTVAQ